MTSIKTTARQAGLLYFVFSVVAIVREFCFPAFLVPGDAAATARNIIGAEFTYRISIVTGFVTHIMFIFLVWRLYNLLKGADSKQALLMVLLVCIGVAVALANLITEMVPLLLLSGADYLSAFTKPQLDALALSALRLHGNGGLVPMAFWGLWLFPFGILVIKSGFFPRILGILLMVAGFAYLVSSFTSIAAPAYKPVISKFMMPLYFGEVPIILWMLVMGARAPQAEVQPSEGS